MAGKSAMSDWGRERWRPPRGLGPAGSDARDSPASLHNHALLAGRVYRQTSLANHPLIGRIGAWTSRIVAI
jgi:hypothetical protein